MHRKNEFGGDQGSVIVAQHQKSMPCTDSSDCELLDWGGGADRFRKGADYIFVRDGREKFLALLWDDQSYQGYRIHMPLISFSGHHRISFLSRTARPLEIQSGSKIPSPLGPPS